ESHIRSIDPHSERDGRDDDIALLFRERFLRFTPRVGAHAGVIRAYGEILFAQLLRERVDVAAANAIDDSRLVFVPLEHFENLLRLIATRKNAIREIGAIEVADEQQRIAQRELV